VHAILGQEVNRRASQAGKSFVGRAAALDVPTIAFFNEVHPLTRIGYYGNVVPKAKPEAPKPSA
jgi:hypothetical protein